MFWLHCWKMEFLCFIILYCLLKWVAVSTLMGCSPGAAACPCAAPGRHTQVARSRFQPMVDANRQEDDEPGEQDQPDEWRRYSNSWQCLLFHKAIFTNSIFPSSPSFLTLPVEVCTFSLILECNHTSGLLHSLFFEKKKPSDFTSSIIYKKKRMLIYGGKK